MRKLTAFVVGAAVALAGLAAGSATASRPEGPPGSVAFVNIGKVFRKTPRLKHLEDGLNADDEALRTSLSKKAADLKKEAEDLETRFQRGTEEYARGRRDIERRSWDLERDQKEGREAIQRRLIKGMEAAYKEVAAEAERLASEKGYTAVMHVDDEPIEVEEPQSGQIINFTDLKLQMALRTVLWNSKAVDLTQDVVDALNKEAEEPKKREDGK